MLKLLLNLNVYRFAYVTYQDLQAIPSFTNETIIAIKAPPETRLEATGPTDSSVCLSSLLCIN